MNRSPDREDSRYARLQAKFAREFPQTTSQLESERERTVEEIEYPVLSKPVTKLVPVHLAPYIHSTHQPRNLVYYIFESHTSADNLFGLGREFFAPLSAGLIRGEWPINFSVTKVIDKKNNLKEIRPFCFESEQAVADYLASVLTLLLEKDYKKKPAKGNKILAGLTTGQK